MEISELLRPAETALGVVERRAAVHDARVSQVYLTERGRQLREPVEAAWRHVDELSVAGFTVEERLILRRLVSLRANLP